MKRSLKLVGVAALSLSGPLMAHAQTTASASATATANVISPLTLNKVTDLAFGSFVRPSTGSNTVIISAADGSRTLGGGGNATVSGSANQRAAFTVAGEGAQTFSISAPGSIPINGPSSSTLTVTLTPSSGTTGTISGTAGNSGSATFGFGGTLGVDTSTVGGAYSGSFTVNVSYN